MRKKVTLIINLELFLRCFKTLTPANLSYWRVLLWQNMKW